MTRILLALLALAVATLHDGAASAQTTYPSRPVKLIVPFPAGGPIDVMARLLSQKLSATFGTVIVENRPGGGGTVGLKAVAAAEPDGYTFLFGGTITLSVVPAVMTGPEGEQIRRMTPVALISSTPFVLIVAPRLPITTIAELITYARANPGKLNFGAPAGATPLLVGELFKLRASIAFTTVPYRGAANTMNDMLSGQIDMVIEPTSVSLAHIHDGKIRPLAVTSRTRSAELPALPHDGGEWRSRRRRSVMDGRLGTSRPVRGDHGPLQSGHQRGARGAGHEARAEQARQRPARRLGAGFRGAPGGGRPALARGRARLRTEV
jgi:tripartite-type tricarboxylate transporter receptor subunit TctC